MLSTRIHLPILLLTCLALTSPVNADEDAVSDTMGDALASISEVERYAPTTRPATPEPQRPPPSTDKNVDTGKPVSEWQRATDDWFGLRPKLDDRGISFQATLVTDVTWNFNGGANPGDSAVRYLFNAGLTLDTERLLNWKGGTFFLSFQNFSGKNGAEMVGGFQGIDNIDARNLTQLSELWFEQVLLDDKVRIKLGKVDAGTEFARVENGGEFLNSSFGFSPTILGFPSYPDPATSINLFAYPVQCLYAGLGIYDGAAQEGIRTGARGPSTLFGDPGDLFFIAEAGFKWDKPCPGRLGAGFWHHTGTFDRFAGGVEHGATGFYITLDQVLWRENPGDSKDEQGIACFVQYGWADPDISPAEHHIGAGFIWTGPIPGRDDDMAGIALSWVKLSDAAGAGFDRDSELVVELFYKLKVLNWLSVKPDLQYIHHPGGAAAWDDVWALTVRIQAEF